MFCHIIRFVPNNHFCVHLWSLSLVLLHFTIISTQGLSQHFEKYPDGPYYQLKDLKLEIPCIVRSRQGECQWLHNGKVIGNIVGKYRFERTPNDGDCSLTINGLNLKSDEGKWQCQVTSPAIGQEGLSSPLAEVIVLVVPNKPVFAKLESGNMLRLPADRSTEVECQSDNGNPLPTIEWFIDGENVTQNSRSNAKETPSMKSIVSYLNHTFKRSHRNSTIICQALHRTINQNTSAIIDAQYAPQVSVSQKVFTVNEGKELRVECQVDANPPTKAIWKLTNNDEIDNSIVIESNYLIISSVSKKMNNVSFECMAQNEFGNSQPVSITLDVLYDPFLLKTSEPQQTVELGGSISLFCDYDGNPKPKIFWYHINPITDQVRERPNDENNGTILHIRNATYYDEGHYYCEAMNHNIIKSKDFIARSSQLIVDVIGKPAIIQNPGVIYGYRSTNTDVEQLFCSDPTPTLVYWTFGSIRLDVRLPSVTNLPMNDNTSKTLRHKARQLLTLEKPGLYPKTKCFRAILSILNTDINDQRDYTLTIENSRGLTQSVISLKVNSPISAAIMITIGLIILIMLFALTLITMLVIKRRRLGKQKADEESKEGARAPMKPDTDKPEKEPEKEKPDNHELVYANLEFVKPVEPQKPTKAKPQAQQRTHKSNGGNTNTTEYASITFANKADL